MLIYKLHLCSKQKVYKIDKQSFVFIPVHVLPKDIWDSLTQNGDFVMECSYIFFINSEVMEY